MKTIVCDHDVDATVEEWPVRPYSKSELARAYAPEPPFTVAARERAPVSSFAGYGLPPRPTDFHQQAGRPDF